MTRKWQVHWLANRLATLGGALAIVAGVVAFGGVFNARAHRAAALSSVPHAADPRQTDPTPVTGPPIVGQTDGPARAVAHHGSTAYVGVGSRVHALDVADPQAVRELGRSPLLRGAVMDLVVADGFLLVGHEFGVTALDMAESSRLQAIGHHEVIGGAANVVVNGDYAYVSGTSEILGIDEVIDISDPHAMRAVGSLSGTTPKMRMAQLGNRLYSLTSDWMSVFDVTNPAAPSQLEDVWIDDQGGPGGDGLAITDAHVFVGRQNELAVFATSDFASTEALPVSTIVTGGPVGDIALRGTKAYVAAGNAGLRVVDVQDPAAPRTDGVAQSPYALRLELVGDVAYVAAHGSGLRAFSIAQPGSPQPLTVPGLTRWGEGIDLAMSGNEVYVGGGGSGLHVVDVSNPTAPRTVAHLDVTATGFEQTDQHLLVVGRSGEYDSHLTVLEPNGLESPRALGTVIVPGSALDVAAHDNIAYVAAGRRGIHVIDFSTRTVPRLVTTIGADWGYIDEVALSGDLLAISVGIFELRLVDVSSPTAPRETATMPLVHFGFGLEFAGGNLWSVGRPDLHRDDRFGFDPIPDYLVHIDVSDPRAPAVARTIEFPTLATDLWIEGGSAFVTSSHGARFNTPDPGLAIINLADGTAMWTLMPSEPDAVAVNGRTAVVTTQNGGLQVIDLDQAPDPTPSPSPSTPATDRWLALLPALRR